MPDELNARELFLAQLAGTAKAQFSQPPISPNDEGDLAFLMAADQEHNVVRLRFSKPVEWLALEPDQAREFAQLILDKVNILESPQDPPQESFS